jgi:hypothetical protein
MNVSLERLIEGIIATLRTDVIPNVTDGYARGQAIGVIDLLNNIGPRIEWARAPVAAAVAEKAELLARIGTLLPDLPRHTAPAGSVASSTAELAAERDRLDAAIVEVLVLVHSHRRDGGSEASDQALRLIKEHLHEEMTREMKLTRKPLFAEIASGGEAKTARQP